MPYTLYSCTRLLLILICVLFTHIYETCLCCTFTIYIILNKKKNTFSGVSLRRIAASRSNYRLNRLTQVALQMCASSECVCVGVRVFVCVCVCYWMAFVVGCPAHDYLLTLYIHTYIRTCVAARGHRLFACVTLPQIRRPSLDIYIIYIYVR